MMIRRAGKTLIRRKSPQQEWHARWATLNHGRWHARVEENRDGSAFAFIFEWDLPGSGLKTDLGTLYFASYEEGMQRAQWMVDHDGREF